MVQQEAKKAWVKPELIVLVRSMPEEAVLSSCKAGLFTGPDQNYGACVEGNKAKDCKDCAQIVVS